MAVLEAPRCKVGGGKVGGEEPVSAGEADGIGEDGTGDGITGAETCSGLRGLRFLSLEANVELEIVDIAVERLSGVLHRIRRDISL